MEFTPEHELFRKSLRGLLEREFEPHLDAWEAAEAMPLHDIFRTLAGAGALGLEYDPAYGGQGADHSYSVVLGE